MSILCCCHHRQPVGKDTQTEAIELPTQPPRATLSKTLSRSETDMYLSSILASRAPSQLITPTYQNIVDPDAVDVEDSDDDDAPDGDTRQSNMSTLGAFRTKIIRRLSHRADVKAGSQPSVGTSDEELARRAELKRLMHKRIQQELKSEEEEDDEENDDHRLASSKQPNISNCKEPELPGGGPRDGIEFSVCCIDEKETKNEADTSPKTSPHPTPIANEPQGPWRKQNSRPGSVKGSSGDSSHEYMSLNEMDSIIQPPSPSRLTPVHLYGEGGRGSPSTASWRLSYSAIHIDSYIEPLVQANQTLPLPSPEPKDSLSLQEDHTINPQEADTTGPTNETVADEAIGKGEVTNFEQGDAKEDHQENSDFCTLSDETSNGRYSPLDVWLWSQELQYTSILSSRPNSEIVFECPRGPEVRGRVEGSLQHNNSANMTTNILIPQGHTSRALHGSSETSANEDKAPIAAPGNETFASNQAQNQLENVIPSEQMPTKGHVQDVSSRYTSSRYTTRSHSQQATPGGSRLSLSELPGNRRAVQPLTPIYGPIRFYHATASDNSGTSSYRTAPNKTPPPDYPKAKLEGSQLLRAEVLSINASETASYRQREEELKSVKKRFGLTPARRHPITPLRSKFREEFEDMKGSSSTRGSILSKLYLALPKRARLSSSQTESSKSNDGIEILSPGCQKSGIPYSHGVELHGDQLLPSSIVAEAHTEGRAVSLWQRAVKPSGANCGRLKTRLVKVSIPNIDSNTTETQPTTVCDQHTDTRVHDAGEEKEASVERPPSPHRRANDVPMASEGVIHDTTDIHSGVLQEWVEQLQAEDLQRQSRAGSKGGVPNPQAPRLRTPPESWAKWPSHTREDRNASAHESDRVVTRDFAMSIDSNPSATGAWRDKTSKGREPTASPRTLPSQVGKALKLGWNKIIIHKGSLSRAPGHVSATQDTQKSQGFLEYPELELLPTAEGYREVQAIEQQIDSMKRRSTSTRGAVRLSSSDSAKSPLASRIAEEVHKIRPEGENIAWSDIEFRSKSSPDKRFLTPAHALFPPRSKLRSLDPASTAAPQCTYEECVQTQMLDDDGANKYECQSIMIKRAKSTGNIDLKLPSGRLRVDEDAHDLDRAPVLKTWKSGLRRHKSLGFLTRVHDGVRNKSRDKSITAEKAKLN